jgi:hypothetical protein
LKINLKLIKPEKPVKIRPAIPSQVAILRGARPLHPATPTSAAPTDDQPLRLLLVRSRPGDLPWLALTIAKTMAPVEIVEVVGFANAIWRLGNEQFDSVLLDVDIRDPAAMAYFREQIADVGAVPVLDLREAFATEPATAPAATRVAEPPEAQAGAKTVRRGLRVPWQRRPRRPVQQVAEPEPVPAAG